MKSVGLVVMLAAVGIAGCHGDCTPSADIQVTVVPSSSVDPAEIASLRVILSVAGGPNKILDIKPSHPLSGDTTFLLRPDPAPAPHYNVAITVEALTQSGELMAFGTTAGDVVSNGCNRLEALLASLPGGGDLGMTPLPDGFTPPDLAGTDLAGCSGGTPDEDGDGRADFCDLCPADFDPQPVDSDRDGLPDACDPDPTTPSNTLLYFEPFNSDSGQWSGGFQITSSYLDISDTGVSISGNGVTSLPANVRVQTSVFSPFYIEGASNQTDFGIFLGSSPNPGGPSTDGMLCLMLFDQGTMQGMLVLQEVENGNVVSAAGMPMSVNGQILYRIRLTQRGANYTCESSTMNGPGAVTVTKMAAAAPTAPQFVALHAQNVEAHFHSVVAESALP